MKQKEQSNMKPGNIVGAILVFFCCLFNLKAQEQKKLLFPYGIWQVSSSSPLKNGDTILLGTLIRDFLFHPDTSVTLQLFRLSSASATLADTSGRYYRLKARWEGNSLSLLFLNGRWEKMFSWKENHFERIDGKALNIYLYADMKKKLTPGMKLLLKQRKLTLPYK